MWSPSINSSIMRVSNCLKILKWNSDHPKSKNKKLVPYRESKLTMLLQPVFTGSNNTNTNVTMLVSCYPGSKDLAEKTSLLKEVESLRGLQISNEKVKKQPVVSRYSVSRLSTPPRRMSGEEKENKRDSADVVRRGSQRLRAKKTKVIEEEEEEVREKSERENSRQVARAV